MVLLLNKDWSPISILQLDKAVGMYILGKAEFLGEDRFPINTINGQFMMSYVLILKEYKRKAKSKRNGCTHKNIFLRDGNKCVYCSSTRKLTIDHINPKSRGGKNTWDNMVTCCHECNAKKGGRTPEEANMKFIMLPYSPNIADIILASPNYNSIWDSYLNYYKK